MYTRTYMWTHPQWSDATRILDNLLTKKILLDITRIRFKSPASKTAM